MNTANDNITRCPQCATAFRVTPEVLQVANGSVRCGSCLRVFNARAHLLNNENDQKDAVALSDTSDNTSQDPSQEKQPTSTPSPLTSDTANEPEDSATNTIERHQITHPPTKHYESVASEFSNGDSANDEPDESWALELLREAEATEALLAKPTKADSDLAPTADRHFSNRPFSNSSNDEHLPINASRTDDTIDDALIDQPVEQPIEPPIENFINDTPDETDHLFLDIINNDLQDASVDKIVDSSAINDNIENENEDDDSWTEGLLVDEDSDPKAAFIPPTKTSNTADNIENTNETLSINTEFSQEEPTLNLQFERDEISFTEEKPKAKVWPWLIGCIFLLACLMAQIAWLQLDEWSTKPPYQSYYANACKILGCQLAKVEDITQIRSTHLVVRSHPDEKNALIVDAIIANNADFQQPFPNIELIFLDIKGKPIASRSFKPNEYVKGQLFGETMMPAKQSIQLSLAIVDPGEKAVNYRLQILAATPTQASISTSEN